MLKYNNNKHLIHVQGTSLADASFINKQYRAATNYYFHY